MGGSIRLVKTLLLLLLCLAAPPVFALGDEEVSYYEALGLPSPTPPGAAQATQAPAPAPTPVYEADGSILLTLSFAGDVTLGRNGKAPNSIFAAELKRQDGDMNFPFRNVKELFLADDLTLVNFEGTLTHRTQWPANKAENAFLFRADPQWAGILLPNGIEAVSLENNHALDYGRAGLQETKESLAAAGVSYAAQGEPAFYEAKGVTLALLAYQTFNGRYPQIYKRLPGDIAAARERAQLVIVSYHWGGEYQYLPNDKQVELGRFTIDSGADLVVGHHSHVVNPIEYYNGRYICYSLGNFSFAGNLRPSDMSTYIFQTRFRLRESVLAPEGFRIIPCRISSRTDRNDFAPTPYDRQQHIDSLLTVLQKNGSALAYHVPDYPLAFAP